MDIDVGNVSDRVIKYLDFDVQLFNAVGDPVEGRIRDTSIAYLRDTGPYRPGEYTNLGDWPAVLYNFSGSCIEILKVDITFVDDSVERLIGDRLRASLLRPDMNDCSYRES